MFDSRTNFVASVAPGAESGAKVLERLQQSLQDTQTFLSREAGQLSNPVVEVLQQAILGIFTDWLAAHPRIAWTFAHPRLALAVLLLSLLLFWGLLRLIFRLSEQVWLFLLQTPLKFITWGIAQIFASLRLVAFPRYRRQQEREGRLADILNRLEAMGEEQEILLAELKELLK
jgi:hypothetical protein